MTDNLYNDIKYNLMTGAIAGTLGTLVSHPFDTIKVHLQTNTKMNIRSRNLYNNTRWFYSGMSPSIIGYTVEKSLIFGTYFSLCEIFNLDQSNIYHTFGAGLTSGLIASFSITIAEQIKIDKQLKQQTKYNFKHLYKGLKYTMAREGIGFGIYFNAYNQLSNYYNNDNNHKLYKTALIGGASAFIAWIPIYPIDINKTRIQAVKGNNLLHDLKMSNTFKSKIKLLYGGYHIAMLRTIPFHSTCFVVYDLSKQYKN